METRFVKLKDAATGLKKIVGELQSILINLKNSPLEKLTNEDLATFEKSIDDINDSVVFLNDIDTVNPIINLQLQMLPELLNENFMGIINLGKKCPKDIKLALYSLCADSNDCFIFLKEYNDTLQPINSESKLILTAEEKLAFFNYLDHESKRRDQLQKENATPFGIFDTLPNELILHLLTYLPPKEKNRFERTSKLLARRWEGEFSDAWKKQIETDYPNYASKELENQSKTHKPFKSIYKDLKSESFLLCGAFLSTDIIISLLNNFAPNGKTEINSSKDYSNNDDVLYTQLEVSLRSRLLHVFNSYQSAKKLLEKESSSLDRSGRGFIIIMKFNMNKAELQKQSDNFFEECISGRLGPNKLEFLNACAKLLDKIENLKVFKIEDKKLFSVFSQKNQTLIADSNIKYQDGKWKCIDILEPKAIVKSKR